MPVKIGALLECPDPGMTGVLSFTRGPEPVFAGLLSPAKPSAGISLGSLLKALDPALALGDLDQIRIRDVLLARANGKFLVGLRLDMDIDLANLPLIGSAIRSLLPPGTPLKIDGFQILVSNGPLTPKDLQAIAAAIQEGAGKPGQSGLWSGDVRPDHFLLPNKLTGSVDFTAGLKLGDLAFLPSPPKSSPLLPQQTPAPAAPPAANPPDPVVSADNTKWIPLGKTYGPVYLKRVGFRYRDGAAMVALDASFTISGITLSLEGLAAGMHVASRTPMFHLDGAGVTADKGPLAISGALVKVSDNPLQFDGMLLVRGAGFSITALASFSNSPSGPSFFAYAVLNRDLGGPACFHVIGLALGLGINRRLVLPAVHEVPEFPLIRAAKGTLDASQMAASLQRYLPAAPGEFWLAAGVRFTSFEIIDSFALLSFSFGGELVIALLGLSTIAVRMPGGGMLAYAELALRAVIRPTEGSLQVEGRLTDNSYIFDPACKLTGGFAFFTWFSGPHAGDFVVTLGGYHPRFLPPAHYPVVPRLAVNWRRTPEFTIAGEMYYAITPSCLMMGGKLSAVFNAGWVRAWFTAYADLLVSWRPFFYDVQMGVSIGVSCHVEIDLGLFTIGFTINISLSVDLRLYGPPFAGEARVDLSVVSFTIRFGERPANPEPLTAPQFVEAFLAAPKKSKGPQRLKATRTGSTPQVLSMEIAAGLLRQEDMAGSREPLRLVNAQELILNVRSLIPCAVKLGTKTVAVNSPCGIRPMGKQNLSSELTVTLTGKGSGSASLRAAPIRNAMPSALWGKSAEENKVQRLTAPSAETIDVNTGVSIGTVPPEPEHSLPKMEIQKFGFEQLNEKVWQLDPFQKPSESSGPAISGIMAPSVVAKRNAILAVLGRQVPFELYRPDLSRMAERVAQSNDYFQAQIVYAPLGQRLGNVKGRPSA